MQTPYEGKKKPQNKTKNWHFDIESVYVTMLARKEPRLAKRYLC